MPDEILSGGAGAPETGGGAPDGQGGGSQTLPPGGGPATPPGGSPPGGDAYQTAFEDDRPRGKVVHETVYNGTRLALTAEDIDRVTHAALQYEYQRRQQELEEQQRGQPRQRQTPPEPAIPQGEPEDKVKVLETRLAEMDLKLKTRDQNEMVKQITEKLEKNLNAELDGQKVFKDYPDLRALGHEQALALLSANPRMTEKAAVQRVAAAQGAAINKAREGYIRKKIADAQEADASPGGGDIATPGPKKPTGRDLMRGRMREIITRRLANAEVS